MKCSGCGNNIEEGGITCPVCGIPLPVDQLNNDNILPGDNDYLIRLLRKILGKKYTINKEIGRGGMGIVYECLDLTLNRKVALKVLPGEFSSNSEFKEMFKREIRTLAQLKHPGIVTIYTAGEADGHLYFTMDYIEGKTLAEVLAERGKIPVNETLGIVINICSALEHAHGKKIIHRDLSPENVMLDRNGNVYIMDFGISKVFNGTGITSTGSIIGKAPYMSPEQCLGEQLDTGSDLYSLGIMTYQMISGCLPFEGESISVMYRHVNENIKSIKYLCPDIPAGIEPIISGCLNKNRDKRTVSAADLRKQCSDKLEPADVKERIKRERGFWKSFFDLKKSIVSMSILILITGIIIAMFRILQPYSFYNNPGETRLDEKYHSLFVMPEDGKAFAYVSKGLSGKYHILFKYRSNVFKGSDYDEISDLKLSNGGEHYCYSARRGEKWFAIYDKSEGKLYSKVKNLHLSDDGATLSYIGMIADDRSDRGSTGVIVHKGIVSDAYDRIGSFMVSRNGEHFVAEISAGGRWPGNGNYTGGTSSILYDGKPTGTFDYTGFLSLSEDGKHYLCKAGKLGNWSGSGLYTKGRWYIIYDGKLSRGFDYVGRPSLGCDGLHYTADVVLGRDKPETESYAGGKNSILYDNRLSLPYDYTTAPSLSVDGLHYIAAARSGNKWYIVYDNKPGEPYNHINDIPLLSTDGEHYAATVRRNESDFNGENKIEEKYHIVYDGVTGDAFDNITDLQIADDGKHYTAIASTGGKWLPSGKYAEGTYYVIYNGAKSDSFDYIGQVILGADGNHYIYNTATGGRWDDNGTYLGGKYSIFKNGEVIENNLYSVNKLWIKGFNWGYSVKRKPGADEFNIEKSFTGSEDNAVSEVYVNMNKGARAYISTIRDVSFLHIEKL